MTNFENSEQQIVTVKARADKAINSLKGILLGIISDEKIDSYEMKELQLWAIEHHDLVNRNPFREFMLLIENTVSNDIPSKEAIEDLYWLCQKYDTIVSITKVLLQIYSSFKGFFTESCPMENSMIQKSLFIQPHSLRQLAIYLV